MRFGKKLLFTIPFLLNGCAATGDQYSSVVENYDNQQLCTAYLENYSTLHSTDVASLNEDKKQYLINLLDWINVRGLDRDNCELVMVENS